MEPYEFIEGHEKVVARFGMWPSFHDGEVHRVVLDSTSTTLTGARMGSVDIHLRGWILTGEVTDKGYYAQVHDSVVHFRFEGVFDLELDGLNSQNVLSSLNLSLSIEPDTQARALHVELEPCYGLSGQFKALEARVVGVVPYEG